MSAQDPVVRRQAAYMRKVLPPVSDGAFDVFTGEAFLEPPAGDLDPAIAAPLAEEAVAEVVDNPELEEQLNELARQLRSSPPVVHPSEAGGESSVNRSSDSQADSAAPDDADPGESPRQMHSKGEERPEDASEGD